MGLADLVHAAGGAVSGAAAVALGPPRAWRRHRAPLLHFLVLGGTLFVLASALAPHGVIELRDADVAQLREEWRRGAGRPPTRAELAASVQQWIGDEALVREAIRLGLDAGDPVVDQRLARNLRFALPDRPGDVAAAAAEARALGMVERDLVVRRRLVDRMEKRMTADLRIGEPELRAYVAAHPERYALPARYRFTQVFVRREHGEARADALLGHLRAGTVEAKAAGDPFPLARARDGDSAADIARQLGAGVAAAVAAAPPREWVGPVASAYGWHLVRVESVAPGAARPFEDVRAAAALALQADRRDQALRVGRARIVARYRVELPPESAP